MEENYEKRQHAWSKLDARSCYHDALQLELNNLRNAEKELSETKQCISSVQLKQAVKCPDSNLITAGKHLRLF